MNESIQRMSDVKKHVTSELLNITLYLHKLNNIQIQKIILMHLTSNFYFRKIELFKSMTHVKSKNTIQSNLETPRNRFLSQISQHKKNIKPKQTTRKPTKTKNI